jgi:hypothetical protein
MTLATRTVEPEIRPPPQTGAHDLRLIPLISGIYQLFDKVRGAFERHREASLIEILLIQREKFAAR